MTEVEIVKKLAVAAARIRKGLEPVDLIAREALEGLAPEDAAAAQTVLDEVLGMRERLDASARAREALLAGVAHDLRNPLNTFAMSTGLIRDDLERGDVDAARELGLVQRMERGIDRMRRMIDDLVDASRIEARRVDLARRTEAATRLVRDAISAADAVAQERSVTIAEGPLDPDARVSVDRTRASQALANILSYCARTIGEGGTVRLSATREGDMVLFVATATAPGAGPALQHQEGKGGVALVIARGLVELHGSTLRIEMGDETRLAFTLPAAP